MVTHKVFVYGSLKLGFYNNPVFPEGSKLLGTARTIPGYTMVDMGAYPGVVQSGDTIVTGELWEVPDLTRLDSLEGHPRFYERHQRPLTTESGDMVDAWIYLLPERYLERGEVIDDGVWKH